MNKNHKDAWTFMDTLQADTRGGRQEEELEHIPRPYKPKLHQS